jgi:hypothetical protein
VHVFSSEVLVQFRCCVDFRSDVHAFSDRCHLDFSSHAHVFNSELLVQISMLCLLSATITTVAFCLPVERGKLSLAVSNLRV